MSNLGQQLKDFRLKRGLSQRQLSLAVDIEQATLSRIERGEMILVSPHIEKLADYLGVEILNPLGSNVAPVALEGRIVPHWRQSTAARDLIFRHRKNEAEQHIMTARQHSLNAFAMTIEDDSMYPQFRRENIVIVDPDVRPNVGLFVVAHQTGSGSAVLGQYALRGREEETEIFELLPLNNLYRPLHSVKDELTVLGVVVEKIELYT